MLNLQALRKCQLADIVKQSELRLDSPGSYCSTLNQCNCLFYSVDYQERLHRFRTPLIRHFLIIHNSRSLVDLACCTCLCKTLPCVSYVVQTIREDIFSLFAILLLNGVSHTLIVGSPGER